MADLSRPTTRVDLVRSGEPSSCAVERLPARSIAEARAIAAARTHRRPDLSARIIATAF